MFLWSEDWASDENMDLFETVYKGLTGGGFNLVIAGTRHYDFSDLPLLSPLSPWFGLKGPIDGRRVLEIISDYSVAFFNAQFNGGSDELILEIGQKYPEVEFQSKGID